MHGGAGGIGTFAIQLAHALGARVFATAGSPEKLDAVRDARAPTWRSTTATQDFVEVVRERPTAAAPT